MRGGLAAALSLMAAAWPAFAHDHPDSAAPASGTVEIPGLPGLGGPFALIDQKGMVRTDQEFLGKLMLVTFGYTDCPDICPLQMQKLTEALALAGPAVAGQIVPLFITVDPSHDTPDRLAGFLSAFDPSIIGLTGSREAIGKVARAYHVHAVEAPGAGKAHEIDHSDLQYLMGRDGKFLTLILPNASAADIAARLAKYAGQA
ncbi:MAG TPA: SCO family protein [Aliidongia sp.]|nr:SCO family protein [Aliidongia sp.]